MMLLQLEEVALCTKRPDAVFADLGGRVRRVDGRAPSRLMVASLPRRDVPIWIAPSVTLQN